MAETIDWKSLGFNFSDDSPLKDLIDQMNATIATSNEMASVLVSNNRKIVGEMQDYVKEAQKVAQSVESINTESATSGKQLAEASKETDKLATSTATLAAIEQDNSKMIENLQVQITALTKAKKDAEKANISEIGSLNELKKNLLDAEKKYRDLGTATDADGKKRTEQLKQVQDLSKQFNTANKAVAEAKKANDTIKGSYQDLASKVAAAKKELKEMGDGFDKSNPKVQSLSKFIKEGSDKLKDFDKAIGDNQRSVGDYSIATQGLSSATNGLSDSILRAISGFKTFFTNPWVLAATALVGAFIALKKSVDVFYTATGTGEDILAERIAGWSTALDVLRNNFAQSAGFIDKALEASSDRFFGVLVRNVAFFSKETATAMIKAKEVGEQLAREADALADDLIDNIVARANSQKVINQATLESQDKLTKSDEQRLQLVKVVGTVRENQLNTDLELEKRNLDVLEKDIAARHSISVEELRSMDREKEMAVLSEDELHERTKIYEQRAKVIDLESQFSQEQKRTQRQLIQLEQEIAKAKLDRINRVIDETNKLNQLILQDEIKTNDEIIKSDKSTLEEKLVALDDNAKLQVSILEIQKKDELNIVQRAAEDRIRAEGKEVTQALLKEDKGLAIQREEILLKFNDSVTAINKQLQDSLKSNVFTDLLKDFNKLTDEVSVQTKSKLIDANKAFQGENIGQYKNLEDGKTNAQQEGEKERLLLTVKYWEDKIALDEAYGNNTLSDQKSLVDAQLALSELEVKGRINNDKAIVESRKQTVKELQQFNQFAQAGFQIIQNGFTEEAQQLEIETNNMQKQYDKQIEAAGDNEEAKKLIEQRYNDGLAVLQAEQLKIRQKQAKADKLAAAFSIAINTATAVIAALAPPPLGLGPVAGLPYSALIGALGIAEEVAVLTKSIPQFKEGTDYAPAGPAIVADGGKPEIGIDGRTGAMTLYDTEDANGILTYLTEGSKIIPGDETERILNGDSFEDFGFAIRGSKRAIKKETKQKQVIDTRSITEPITAELRRNRPKDVVRIANDIYDVKILDDGSKHYIRSKSMGK